MNLPPYLVDPPPTPDALTEHADERPRGPEPTPHGTTRLKIAIALVVVALVAGTVGAIGTRVLAAPAHDDSTASTTTVSKQVGKVGVTETVGSWRVVVVNWGAGPLRRGGEREELIAWITLTNTANHTRTWNGPEQVALRYRTADGAGSREYVDSADESARGTQSVGPGEHATLQYIWRLPAHANLFELRFRPDARSPRAAQVSLACC
jgi:hypothetical protein